MSTRDTLALMRVRQWSKNLAVYAAIIFSGELFDLHALALVTAGFVAFCLTASALYVVNDILDAERDRQHPLKKNRPVASGRIEPIAASGIAAALLVLGIGLSVLLGVSFLLTIGAYLVLQLLYAAWLKHALIVDMLVIGAGFVLRAVAGAEVISVPVSPWLVICTGLLALFLAAAKRRHELVLLEERSSSHRPVLAEYSVELLDSFMVTLSAATITTYALYTFFEVRSPNHTMMMTLPFVIYGLLRYQYLVLRRDGGGRPEDVLLGDGPIMIDVALWIASAVFVLYALPRFIN